jgi:hypothetical protein
MEKDENIGQINNIGGWCYDKHGWWISWYNLDNFTENEFDKKWNKEYQAAKENGEKGWKKIFKLMRYVHFKDERGYDDCEAVGLCYCNRYSETSLSWVGKKNIYRFYLRYAPTITEKGRWKIKFAKWHNSHDGC